MSIAQMAREICGTRSVISGSPKQPVHTMDNAHSKKLGVHYPGIEGVKRYMKELVELV